MSRFLLQQLQRDRERLKYYLKLYWFKSFEVVIQFDLKLVNLDPVHTGPYGHHINLTSFKTSMTLKFVIILQNLIKTYHRKSGKSKCDRKVTELNVEIKRIRSRVNGVLEGLNSLNTSIGGLALISKHRKELTISV